MVDLDGFKEWLKNSTDYSEPVIGDMVSRMKRADSIHSWDGNDAYLFYLSESPEFKLLSTSVRSQLRKASKLYAEYKKQV